jgi:hypothetical protein
MVSLSRWEKEAKTVVDKVENKVEYLFPGIVKNPVSPALPLEQYAGTYFHPGYQNITLTLEKTGSERQLGSDGSRILYADHTDFTWQTKLEFRHVSGEYWVMEATMAKAPPSLAVRDIAAAGFKIGVDGRPAQFGIEWQDTLSGVVDGWIWYDRIE